MSKETCKNVSFFIKFVYDLSGCLEYLTVILWYMSCVSSSVCRYHSFRAITFVKDKFKGTKGVSNQQS